jgi:asparagine synthase (glutamine-hydrolysing)
MCGIAGILSPVGRHVTAEVVGSMALTLRHRGPDDAGVWVDADSGVALAHRRLAILDLTPAGHQPMVSAGGRFVIVFNGEIYNHADLRAQLHDVNWRGHSDTETLLAGFERWGIRATIQGAVGMFAFAVWDRQTKALTLGRDRLGEKPLYYGWQGETLLFASELKALRAHPVFAADIDRGALALLMRYSAVPAPFSIYQGIRKLVPGSLLTIRPGMVQAEPERYWDACRVIADCLASPYDGTPDEAVKDLERVLRQAVAQQMLADVPLGAFLSGGVDSSTVVALMQAGSMRPVRTFSIGFHEVGYNEAEHAAAVAKHLGTDHTELYVSARQALDVIPRLPELYCEPFADSSQVPTFLVSELARRHVTVSLSGDGGDELFGGYNRYVLGQRLWGRLSRAPVWLRVSLAHALLAVSPTAWNGVLGPLQAVLPVHLRQANVGAKLHKGAAVIAARDSADVYRLLVSLWHEPEKLVLGAREPPTVLTETALQPRTNAFVHDMMALDLLTYLPDDILAKVDRAAMAVSLETRVPLLDHRVVELAWRLPLDYKLRDGVGKWPLRQVLYKYVPRMLIERPKMGFSIPVDHWLRGPLREWAEGLLDAARLREQGYFDVALVRSRWSEHLSGRRDWQYQLWNVLMFQQWLEATR